MDFATSPAERATGLPQAMAHPRLAARNPACWFERQGMNWNGMSWNEPEKPSPIVSFQEHSKHPEAHSLLSTSKFRQTQPIAPLAKWAVLETRTKCSSGQGFGVVLCLQLNAPGPWEMTTFCDTAIRGFQRLTPPLFFGFTLVS